MRGGRHLIPLVLLLAAVARADDPEPEKRWSWYAIPVASADTDDGVGGGVRAELARTDPVREPYRWAFVLHLFASNTGFHHHRLRFDAVDVGRWDTRVSARISYRQWLNDTYAGIGPQTVRETAYTGDLDPDDPDRKRYRYQLVQPYGYLSVRQPVRDGPVQLAVAISPRWNAVEAYPGSLLEADQPYGMAGGVELIGLGGVLLDTREPEIAPESGVLLELSARGAPDLGGEAGGFGGPFASARGFVTPIDRLTLAGRLMGEWLFGTVPFWEMAQWGGVLPVESGAELARGLRYGRFRGPGKAVANGELRWLAIDGAIRRTPVGLELAPFVDALAVSGPAGADGAWRVHPAAGLGVRAILDRTFVGRLDFGWGADPVVDTSGAVTQVPTLGFYLTFDHPF